MYSDRVAEQINKKAAAAMERIVAGTKALAPRRVQPRGQHFVSKIDSQELETTTNKTAFVWYVRKPKYRLAHLLESDHKSRSGRVVSGFHFIQKTLDKELPVFETEVKEVLRNAD